MVRAGVPKMNLSYIAPYNSPGILNNDLSNCNLSGSDMSYSSFVKCNFDNSNLSKCNLTNALFSKCSFNKTNLKNIKVDDDTNFFKSSLSKAINLTDSTKKTIVKPPCHVLNKYNSTPQYYKKHVGYEDSSGHWKYWNEPHYNCKDCKDEILLGITKCSDSDEAMCTNSCQWYKSDGKRWNKLESPYVGKNVKGYIAGGEKLKPKGELQKLGYTTKWICGTHPTGALSWKKRTAKRTAKCVLPKSFTQ